MRQVYFLSNLCVTSFLTILITVIFKKFSKFLNYTLGFASEFFLYLSKALLYVTIEIVEKIFEICKFFDILKCIILDKFFEVTVVKVVKKLVTDKLIKKFTCQTRPMFWEVSGIPHFNKKIRERKQIFSI